MKTSNEKELKTNKRTAKIESGANFEELILDDKKNQPNLTKEQQEIINLKSQLLIEKINRTSKTKESILSKRRPRRFRDTEYDKNATTKSLLKGAGFMAFAFGMIILFLLLIR